MKNIKIVLVLLFSTLFLVSCDYTRIGWHDRTGNSMYGKFDYFNGDRALVYKVNEGETINIIVELNTEEGEMYVNIFDDSGDNFFATDVSTTFEFTAEEDTKLKAKVFATKAGGSYKVTFEK